MRGTLGFELNATAVTPKAMMLSQYQSSMAIITAPRPSQMTMAAIARTVLPLTTAPAVRNANTHVQAAPLSMIVIAAATPHGTAAARPFR